MHEIQDPLRVKAVQLDTGKVYHIDRGTFRAGDDYYVFEYTDRSARTFPAPVKRMSVRVENVVAITEEVDR